MPVLDLRQEVASFSSPLSGVLLVGGLTDIPRVLGALVEVCDIYDPLFQCSMAKYSKIPTAESPVVPLKLRYQPHTIFEHLFNHTASEN